MEKNIIFEGKKKKNRRSMENVTDPPPYPNRSVPSFARGYSPHSVFFIHHLISHVLRTIWLINVAIVNIYLPPILRSHLSVS